MPPVDGDVEAEAPALGVEPESVHSSDAEVLGSDGGPEPVVASEADSATGTASEATADVDAGIVTELASEAVVEAGPAAVTEPAAVADPGSEARAETGSDEATGFEPVAEAQAEPTSGAEAEPTPGAEGPGGGAPAAPTAPRQPRAAGRVLEGVVIRVSADEVELTLDDGRPAVINRRNFGSNDEDPTTLVSIGDRTFGAELAREDPKSRVVLSRAWALKKKAWDDVVAAKGTGATVQGKVVSLGAKGVVVDVGVRGFVPSSHLALEPVADLAVYKDQTLELKVLEADPQRERLVLSRKSLLLKEQRKKSQELLGSLKAGETRRGVVTSITDYGCFVDIGGVQGLVHLSELSWKRVRRPNDVVALGEEVEVRILDVKTKKRRISLSIRQLRPDPLTELQVGEVRWGPVTRLVDFGAFVALGDDVEGLVHLSELAEYRVSTPEEVVAPGDEVGVKILSVDTKRRRVELSIRRAAEYGG